MPYANREGANREGPEKCARPCSQILAFFVRRHILLYPLILKAGNKSPDQSVHVQADLGLALSALH